MKIYLIRHGKTKGNLEERYIGRTDEPLCEAGRENLKKYQYPQVEMVFTSPMKRCMQTAETIYPGQQYQCIEELRESDFGAFEGHTYKELSGDVRYQAWIDSGGTLPFPGGEEQERSARPLHPWNRDRIENRGKGACFTDCICRTWWNDHERDGEICKTAGAVL